MAKVRNPTNIGVLVYPGAQLSAVYGLTDLLMTANRIDAEREGSEGIAFCVSHWQTSPASRELERNGCSIEGDQNQLGVLVVPPSLETHEARTTDSNILGWITKQHKGGAVICSICAGAFILGQAGLLQGRVATTHWALRNDFAAQFPEVQLETDKLIIEDGDIITAGGVMAWVDLGLKLVDRFISPSVMLEVARFFLVDPSGREQRFYSTFAPHLSHGDHAILRLQHWLQANCQKPTSIASMSSLAGLSERTFLRRFQKATGLKPTAYVQVMRVGKAREFLETSSMPLNQVAWKVGYEDPAAFAKVFQKIMGLSPGDYRRRFSVR